MSAWQRDSLCSLRISHEFYAERGAASPGRTSQTYPNLVSPRNPHGTLEVEALLAMVDSGVRLDDSHRPNTPRYYKQRALECRFCGGPIFSDSPYAALCSRRCSNRESQRRRTAAARERRGATP